jgi:ferredoxin
MRLEIDRASCEGHGRCYAIAPELFEPDELGDGQVLGDGELTDDQVALAERAVANCPEQAITITGRADG